MGKYINDTTTQNSDKFGTVGPNKPEVITGLTSQNNNIPNDLYYLFKVSSTSTNNTCLSVELQLWEK